MKNADLRENESGSRSPGADRAGGFIEWLVHAKRFRQLFPKRLRRFGRRFLPHEEYESAMWATVDACPGAELESTYPPKVDVKLGILKGWNTFYTSYIVACRELGVPYQVLDIFAPNWLDLIRGSGCDAFLVWPPTCNSGRKEVYDERLKVIAEGFGKPVYPSYDAAWLYESKRRTYDWLKAYGAPHPRTWVFCRASEALEFCRTCDLPIVFKLDRTSGALGVWVLRKRSALHRFVKRFSRKGITLPDGDPRDRQWGSALFQEFVPDTIEWRVIRMDDSYFAYQKGRRGDFHSGSGLVDFADPPPRLLDIVRQLTDKAGFTSMSFDVFETPDGRFLINELHPVFGRDPWDHSMEVGGKPGRYVYEQASAKYVFEEGIFTENACCNLRVKTLLKMLGKPLEHAKPNSS